MFGLKLSDKSDLEIAATIEEPVVTIRESFVLPESLRDIPPEVGHRVLNEFRERMNELYAGQEATKQSQPGENYPHK